ncbi:MAG: endopeptidase La [Acidimicrobiales bacterium]|nr:endopeptidase La [Acidimicrobiales bacterium]
MPPIATSALPLLPLDAGVVLPGMTITLALETDEAREAVAAATGAGDRLVLVPRVGRRDGPDSSTGHYARVGTIATIGRTGSLPGGTPAVVVSAEQRATIGAATAVAGAALWVNVEAVDEGPAHAETEDAARELRAVLEAIAEHRGMARFGEVLRGISDPGRLADTAGYWPDLSIERKVELLEAVDPNQRVGLVLSWAREALAELELKDRIRSDVAEGMERTQREYLLRQQLAAIRKELGETEGGDGGEDYRARLDALSVTDEVRQAIAREIDKLERTSEQSPEHGWIRTWLDSVFDIPWGKRSSDQLDIIEARGVLDADHTGLDDVKERIIEHLAVRKLRLEREIDAESGRPGRGGDGMILALVGPPGVGKTSLGESVARAMGRKFVRVALGGVRDEAEIRGHRRTYVGAMPGRIVRALKDAGTVNPVILLDEVDKLGSDFRGDPSSALLEVLDPAQNHTFRDHYLDLDLDLSGVLFLATANMAEQIPGPLYDRMEVVRLDGYTVDEKLAIARDHLMARQLARAGLLAGEVDLTDEALRAIIEGYTREAGVRGLERELGKLLRKAAARVASGPTGQGTLRIDATDVKEWLGRPRHQPEVAERTSVPGVATGLAVTGAGGDVLFVEASASDGEPGLTITGQLGEVMQESAQIALSYVRAHAGDLGIPAGSVDHKRLHLHVPAGAVPKDGPSAGVTMTTAIVSLLSGAPVRPEVGMTGEITLQGKVLPIGGVKQKVLAAHRAGLSEVVLPARNEPDIEDVPEAVRKVMKFHLASEIGEVLEHALTAKSLAA